MGSDIHHVIAALAPLCGVDRFEEVLVAKNRFSSSHRSWLIKARVSPFETVEFHCKAGRGGARNAIGDPTGDDYEARVYEQFVAPWHVAAPKYYGCFNGRDTGDSYLVLESLTSHLRLHSAPQPEAMLSAATWLGRSQRSCAEALSNDGPGLIEYTAETFRRWMSLAAQHSGQRSGIVQQIAAAENDADTFGALGSAERTLVHGECYPANILVLEHDVRAVDWEWAGIGPGEIDFAALTEGWPADVAAECLTAYTASRWPGGLPPHDVRRAVDTARLYFIARRLGRDADRVHDSAREGYFSKFAAIAAALGLR